MSYSKYIREKKYGARYNPPLLEYQKFKPTKINMENQTNIVNKETGEINEENLIQNLKNLRGGFNFENIDTNTTREWKWLLFSVIDEIQETQEEIKVNPELETKVLKAIHKVVSQVSSTI